MELQDFKLERYFAKYEFKTPYLLCCSDCESFTVQEILNMEGEDSLKDLQELWLGYTESTGSPELQEQIAGQYQKMKPGNVLVTSGAEEAIFIFMNVALAPGDHVIVQYPCYQSLFEVARAIGCNITKWEIAEEDGWELDIDFLARNINEKTKAIIVNSPHNPTGYLIPQEKMNGIVELARSRDILLFSDEVYRFLEYDYHDRPAAACDMYEHAVSLGVMSKSYGLAGLRIGWAATRNADIYRKMAGFKDYTSICNSAPGEFLATVALKNRERLVKRNLEIIQGNLTLLDQFFGRYGDMFAWPKPKAGPIAFPSIKWNGNVEDFCIDLVNTKGVLLLPGNYYDYSDKHFRIGFGRKNMPEGLERLEEYVREKNL